MSEEQEPGKRPSRKAAVEAAKKIFNTVRHFNVKDVQPIEESPSEPPPSLTPPSTPNQVKKKGYNGDLEMLCEEDELSDIQVTRQSNAQLDFNFAMKNLRDLMACPVTIVQEDPNPVDFNVSVNVFEDDDNFKAKQKKRMLKQKKRMLKQKKRMSKQKKQKSKSHDPNVYPVLLTKLSNMEETPIIYV